MFKRIIYIALLPIFFTSVVLGSNINIIDKRKGKFSDIWVFDINSLDARCISFEEPKKNMIIQSCVYKNKPHLLHSEYLTLMMSSFILMPFPKNILVVGLGGGSIVKPLLSISGGNSNIDIIEIDGEIIDLAKKHFGLAEENINVIEGDAYILLNQFLVDKKKYDMIFFDAFEKDYISSKFLNESFITLIKDLLNDDGIVTFNTFSNSKYYDKESDIFKSVFGKYLNIKSTNRVILAKNGSFPTLSEIKTKANFLYPKLYNVGVDVNNLIKLISENYLEGEE